MEIEPRRKPHRRRLPRQATASHLENAALHYLERFSSSSANLRRVLLRKVARSARAHGTDPTEGAGLVEAIIARYLQSGLLDDAAYAAQKAASLRRRGTSLYGIRGKLALKGVEAELIGATLERLDEDEGSGDLAAACALARRRRLGPYRPPGARAEHRRKDLAAFARAGFSLDVARRVLAAADIAAVEALARGEEPG
ncbi:MAG TPA: RecX family transcriptional regulator [Stellaceae bacterium]|nr:RecX family transcriptional regulator [Stellaceae bacterium]